MHPSSNHIKRQSQWWDPQAVHVTIVCDAGWKVVYDSRPCLLKLPPYPYLSGTSLCGNKAGQDPPCISHMPIGRRLCQGGCCLDWLWTALHSILGSLCYLGHHCPHTRVAVWLVPPVPKCGHSSPCSCQACKEEARPVSLWMWDWMLRRAWQGVPSEGTEDTKHCSLCVVAAMLTVNSWCLFALFIICCEFASVHQFTDFLVNPPVSDGVTVALCGNRLEQLLNCLLTAETAQAVESSAESFGRMNSMECFSVSQVSKQ